MKYLISIVVWCVGISVAAEEPNAKAGKYHSMLEKRPSSGYLFDRFYNAWLDTGSIDGLGEFLKNESKAADAELGDRLLLAWFLAKQGEDAGALEVFNQALKEAPDNAEAWFEKAKIEARTLNFEAAVSDLDKAVEVGAKSELAIRIAKLKGQLLIRDGKNEAALAAWKSLLSENDDDEDLYEDVIELQIEEGLYDEAIATSKALVEQTGDPYKKVLRQLRMGDIFQRAGKRDEALAAYESSLAQVGGGTWIEKEILSQIERVFRREDDVSGLAERLKLLAGTDGKRISIQRRYAEVLMESGQEEEAVALFEKIIALTPGDRAIREEYIDLLSKAERYEKAIPQLEALIEQNSQDGELLIRLAALQDAADDKEAAGKTLSKFLEQSDGSEYAYLRVARLEEQYELTDEAEVTYRKILEAFPDSIASRETFAAFLHRLDRKEEALNLWKGIAASGDRAQAIRIARTLASRLEHEAAFEVLHARFDELKTDPVFLGQLIVEAVVLKKIEEAVPWSIQRVNLIDEPIDLEAAVKQAAQVISKSEEKSTLISKLRTDDSRTIQETCLLAELLENEADYDAVDALLVEGHHAGELLILTQRIRSLMARELWEKAAEATKDLIEGQGGRKTLFVRNLVNLYERAGNTGEALKWIPEWKTMSPGSIEPWMTEASLLRGDRKTAEAITVLRLAANKFEGDTTIRSELAQLYTEEGKSADAQRIYQRLYDEGESLTDKLQWVSKLTDTAQNLGKLDTLIDDYKDRQRNNRESIAPLMALAEMHRTTGDYEERRKTLLEAARMKPDDIGFLLEVARIEESEGDWEAGLATLEKARKIENSVSVREKIAAIKLRNGDEEAGYKELAALAKENMDADRVLKLAEAISTRYAWERLNNFLEPWLVEFPKDYRLHYLRAVALEESDQPLAAAEVFLSLIEFDEEIKGNLAIDPMKRSMSRMPAKLPEGMMEFYRFRQSIYQAYRYRQNQSQNYFSYGGLRGTGQTVSLPPTIDYVASYAMTHLNGLISFVDDDKAAEITKKLETSGAKNAVLFSKLTFNPNRSSYQIPDELLDHHPENKALHAFWLEANQSNVTTELARFENAFDLLGEEFPRYGVMAALGGARLMDEKSPAMLAKAIEILKQVESPDYTMFTMVTRLITQSLTAQGQGVELKKAQRDDLIDLAMTWYPKVMEQSSVNQSYVFRSAAGLLRASNRSDEFLKLVEDRISELAKKPAFSSLYAYRGSQNQRMISPLPFPNNKLNLIPQEVSSLFPANQNVLVYTGFGQDEPEPDTPLQMAEKTNHPMVKLLLMIQGSADDEAIAKVVESLVDSDKPTLDSAMLAAGWAARQNEYEKVISRLSEAKFLPMSRTQRQELDGAIVHAAIELGADNKTALEAGQAAALRLRHGRLLGNQRQELAGALGSLGLEEEAERQEEKLASALNRSSSIASPFASSMGFAQPQNNQNRIQQLVSQGKKDQAVKEASRTLLQWGLSAASPQNSNNWDYYSRELKTQLARLNLMSEVLSDIENSKRVSKKEQLEYAGVQLIMGEEKEALASYQKVLEKYPKESGAQMQAAILLAETDLQAAEKLVAQIDPTLKQQIGAVFSQKINNYDGEQFEAQMSTIRLVMSLLEDVEHPERIDFSWVLQPIQWLVSNQSKGDISLPHLYLTPEKKTGIQEAFEKSNPSAENRKKLETVQKLNQQRRELHDRFCELMLKIPQLAATGFSCSRAAALADGKPEESFRPLAIESLKLAASSLPKRDIQVDPYLKNEDGITILDPYAYLTKFFWETNDRDGLYKKLIPEIKAAGRNGRTISRRLELLSNLYFDDENDFSSNTKLYTNTVASLGVNINYEFPKLVEVMRSRKLSTEQVQKILKDRSHLLFSQNNRPGVPEAELIELIYERDGRDIAEATLEELGDIWLGPREKRKQFIADHYNPQNRYNTTQSRNIYNFSYSMRTITDREKLTFLGLDFCDRYGIPREGWPYFFRRSSSYEDADQVMTWLKKSPFLSNDLSDFRFYMAPKTRQSSGRASIFEEVLYGIRNYANDETRTELAEKLKAEKGLGADMFMAVATDRNKPEKLIVAAADFQTQIEELEDEESRLNWIRLFDNQYSAFSKSHTWPDEIKPFIAFIKKSGAGLANENLDTLLAAKQYSDLKLSNNHYNFDNYIAGLMRDLEGETPDQAIAVFYKACEIVAAEQKNPQGWRGSSVSDGSNFGYELLDDYANGTATFERLKILTDILSNSEPLTIPVSGASGSLNIYSLLSSEFDRIKNEGLSDKPIEALDKLFRLLNEKLDPRSMAIVSNDFARFAGRLSSNEKKAVFEFCEANQTGKPHSKWVNEFGMAIRSMCFNNETTSKQYSTDGGSPLPNPDAFIAYYQKQLQDESLLLTHRLLTANTLLATPENWPDSYITEAFSQLTTVLAAESAMIQGSAFSKIVGEFSDLPKSEIRSELAADFFAAWKNRNRYNSSGSRNGKAFTPNSSTVMSAFRVAAAFDRKDIINRLQIQHRNYLTNSTPVLIQLLNHGHHEIAAKDFKKNFYNYRPSTSKSYPYEQKWANEIPAFTKLLPDEEQQFFAELILRMTVDPTTSGSTNAKSDDDKVTPRAARAMKLAEKLKTITFKNESLKERSITFLLKEEKTFQTLAAELANVFEKVNFNAIGSIEDYDLIQESIRIPMIHALNEIEKGNPKPLNDLWRGIVGGSAQNYYLSEGLNPVVQKIHEQPLKAYSNPDVGLAWLSVLETIHGTTPNDIYARLNNFDKSTSDQVILSIALDQGDRLSKWLEELPEERSTWFKNHVKKNGALVARLRKLINPENKAITDIEAGPRLALVKRFVSSPFLHEIQPYNSACLTMLAKGCMTPDELFSNEDEFLKLFPRKGLDYIDLANAYQNNKKHNEAIATLATGLEKTKPTKNRLNRFIIGKATNLNLLNKKEAAVTELKKVNLADLDTPTRKKFEQLARTLKYTPPKEKPKD